jgi:tetratricopeptide (TPR) repeat protein
MQLAPLALRRLAASLAIWLALSASASAQEEPSGLLLARLHPELEVTDLAAGHAYWLHQKLTSAGLAVTAAPALPDTGPRGQQAIAALQAQARAAGAAALILPELRVEGGLLEVRLPLYEVSTGALIAAPRASAPLAEPGGACEETAARLLTQLGVPAGEIPTPTPPLLDELAASGRALRLLEASDLGSAWRELEGKLAPTSTRLREDIAARARNEETPRIERARVLALTGDAVDAWTLLAPEVTRGAEGPPPDPRALLAAGQAQLARSDGRAARNYLDQLLAIRPDDPELHLELGHAATLQGDLEAARAALARSAQLDPTSPLPLVMLAEVDAGDPRRQAQHLLEAGRREARRLNPRRAEHYFERAIDLDPETEQQTLRAIGAMNQRIGRPNQALAAFTAAREAGDADAVVFAGIGVAQRRLRQEAAEASLRRALSLDPKNPDALRELAELYTEKGRPKEAVRLLEQAVALEPDAAEPRRALAIALQASGDSAGALRVLGAPQAAGAGSADFRLAAQIHRAQGNLPAARDELHKALELSPHDPGLRSELASVLQAQGDAGGARQARQLAQLLDDGSGQANAETETAASNSEQGGLDFTSLVESFAVRFPDADRRRVAMLGLREPASWQRQLMDWALPRVPDRSGLENALKRDLGKRFLLIEPPADAPALQSALNDLYAFESKASVSSSAIANVVSAVGTDAVLVARLVRSPAPVANPKEVSTSCADPKRFEIEMRMLSGSFTEAPTILVDLECLPAGMERHGVWNLRAPFVYAAVLLLLLYPVIRGWGTIVVQIKLPARTKGFMRIRISSKPEKVQDQELEKQRRNAQAGRLARSLSSFSRYVKYMAGRETVFRWIPARKRGYVVTVRGPLEDAISGEVIGHFLEEQRVLVLRGQTAKLEYDFCPDECAVEVVVTRDGKAATGARAAVRGDLRSLRYAREGNAFLYLRPGQHLILVGHEDRACQRPIEIDNVKKALRVAVDLSDGADLAFEGCPGAVDPYLLGDFATTASMLEAAGHGTTAALLRAGLHRERGEHQRAASEFEAAGRLEEAAEMHASGSDFRESAELFERAGNFARAAETYRAGGDALAAARCYEAAYDYDAALECYDEAGDVPKVIDLLEKAGAYLEAGRRAHQLGDADRALRILQRVERRDTSYGEACVLMAELLVARGDAELAASKLEEAIQEAGGEDAPSALHERHAALLEQAGQRQQALDAYQALHRRDPARDDITERINTLRRGLESTPIAGGDATRLPAASPESRYELLAELGRGGMGVVYQARDKRLGRMVALKRLPESLRTNPTAVELFLREAQAAAMLNHRNIVTLFDAGEEDGVYFISMELLEGMPLNAILEKRGRLSTVDTARLGIQICSGLQYAHDRRIVHRDIKTANLFFTRERVVKIMDFGLAKTIEEVRRSSTMVGGTPYYMAPEQAAGEAVDNRTDLYALGVTFFRLVTGSLPFVEGDLIYHHRHTPAPDAREIEASIPERMAALLAKLLAKQPDQRCQSANEVASELQAMIPSR